jgi:hypothetical protein
LNTNAREKKGHLKTFKNLKIMMKDGKLKLRAK